MKRVNGYWVEEDNDSLNEELKIPSNYVRVEDLKAAGASDSEIKKLIIEAEANFL